MCDDFWSEREWQVFERSMKRVFPDRPIVDLENGDPIFHAVYDLSDRYQVPGARIITTGSTEKCFNCPARWRGIYDDKGRILVAICFESDIGDSWNSPTTRSIRRNIPRWASASESTTWSTR